MEHLDGARMVSFGFTAQLSTSFRNLRASSESRTKTWAGRSTNVRSKRVEQFVVVPMRLRDEGCNSIMIAYDCRDMSKACRSRAMEAIAL